MISSIVVVATCNPHLLQKTAIEWTMMAKKMLPESMKLRIQWWISSQLNTIIFFQSTLPQLYRHMTSITTSLPTPKISIKSIHKQAINSISSLCRLTWPKRHQRLNKNWLGQCKPSRTTDPNRLLKMYVGSKTTTTWETRRKSLQAKSNNNSLAIEARTTARQRGRSKKNKSVD